MSLACTLGAFSYDAKFYMGVGGGKQYEKFTDSKRSESSSGFGALKFGYGDRRAYAVECKFYYIDNHSNIFSPDDKERYAMDIMFVKAYNLAKHFYPLMRAGFGAGEMHVQRKLEKKIAFSSYNLALGALFPFGEHFDLEADYEYRFTSYQAVDLVATKEKLRSHSGQVYFGVNYRF